MYQEDIATATLSQKSAGIQQYWPGVWRRLLRLQARHNQIQIVMGLCRWIEGFGRRAPGRWHHHFDTVTEHVRPFSQRQGHTCDDYRGLGPVSRPVGIVGTSRHPQENPVVISGTQKMCITFNDLLGNCAKFIGIQSRIDLHITQ